MSRTLLAVVLCPALLAGCGASDPIAPEGPSARTKACGTLPTADPAAKLSEGLATVDGTVLYEPSTQGKTEIVFGLVAKDDFVAVRDELASKLKDGGWTIDGTDQESVEAEAQFSKQSPLRTATIKVQPLCKGYSTVRYKLNT